MSNTEQEVRLSMRVMINKDNTKVLFALIDNNFADVLLSFLTLPLGVILRLLKKHYADQAPIIGCLNSMQAGIATLDMTHFCEETGKLMLLNPRNSLEEECRKLKINIDDTQPIKYFTCEKIDCGYARSSIRMYHGAESVRCGCGKAINREISLRDSNTEGEEGDGEVFTVKTASFLVSDDLRLLPNVTVSIVQSLKTLGVEDVDGAQQKTITVGIKEIMELFKGSLFSKTPLTDLILHPKQMHPHSPTMKSEQCALTPQIGTEETTDSKKFIVKIMLQKSTNKLLFAESEEDFVDFLFSFLTLPLGEVESVLNGNSSFGCIDNLYNSLQNLNADKYMKNQDKKDTLLEPELPPKFLSQNQLFSLIEKNCPSLYYHKKSDEGIDYLSPYYTRWTDVKIKDPKGGENYVKGPGMFMVTDDLTVTPLCMFSSLSTLKEMNISLSDVEELEVQIGLEEGSSILKASLSSSAALTNGLNLILKKEVKDEI